MSVIFLSNSGSNTEEVWEESFFFHSELGWLGGGLRHNTFILAAFEKELVHSWYALAWLLTLRRERSNCIKSFYRQPGRRASWPLPGTDCLFNASFFSAGHKKETLDKMSHSKQCNLGKKPSKWGERGVLLLWCMGRSRWEKCGCLLRSVPMECIQSALHILTTFKKKKKTLFLVSKKKCVLALCCSLFNSIWITDSVISISLSLMEKHNVL